MATAVVIGQSADTVRTDGHATDRVHLDGATVGITAAAAVAHAHTLIRNGIADLGHAAAAVTPATRSDGRSSTAAPHLVAPKRHRPA